MGCTLSERWNRFWFAPADPRLLGFVRVLLLLGAFAFYRRTDFESWGFVRNSFWTPIFLFHRLHLHPMGPLRMWGIGFLWKLLLITGGIGLFTRTSCAGAFVLGIYLLGLPNNLGKIDHSDSIVLWGFLVMAIARSGDAWSIDSLIRTARSHSSPADVTGLPAEMPPPALNAEYRWPIKTLQVLMVTIFFASGTTKLRHSGFYAWAFSDNLRNTFLQEQYLAKPWVSWGVWIAGHPHLCMGLAAFTLLAETTSPLALFSRTARMTLMPILFFMQVGNELLLGINFRQFMLCYAVWVDWLAVGRTLQAQLGRRDFVPVRATVLFDGSCGLCTRTMAILRRLDLFGRVEVLDMTHRWAEIAARYPGLDQSQCLRLMHVIDERGRITIGFDAYRALARIVPAGWPLVPLSYLPGVPVLGRKVYQAIADRRFRNGCGVGSTTPLTAPAG